MTAATVTKLAFPSLRDRVGAEEWETRVELAAWWRTTAGPT
ncbi:MAG: hypothetical protein QF738_03545 [Rhodospirillales bacterium]|jgi:hypothetical protein|nr:hypothetical protein [Rhodospirillales bacterium]